MTGEKEDKLLVESDSHAAFKERQGSLEFPQG